MSTATNNNVTHSICTFCYHPLGEENEQSGVLDCCHCVHESCYLSYVQEAVFQNDKCAQPECPTCKDKIMAFTRLFLEPDSMGDQYDKIPPGTTICAICLQALDARHYASDDMDFRSMKLMGALNCGHCFHMDCYENYIDHHKGVHDRGTQLECPTCKTHTTSFTPLDLQVTNDLWNKPRIT